MYKKPNGKLGKIVYNSKVTPWQNVDDLPEDDFEGGSEEEELEDPLDVLDELEDRLEELEEKVAQLLTTLCKKSETCQSSQTECLSSSLSQSQETSLNLNSQGSTQKTGQSTIPGTLNTL